MSEQMVPKCAGCWIACVTCDGGTNSAGDVEEPCSWRSRCKAIQDHMTRINSDPQLYRRRYGQNSLIRLLDRLRRERMGKGKPGPKPKPKKKKRKKKPGPKPSPEKKKSRRYAHVQAMMTQFVGALSKAVDGRVIVWCEKRTQAVKPGCVYIVDRSKKGNYYSLYLRRATGRPHKLCVIRLAPINRGLDIQLPDKEPWKELPEELKHTLWRDKPMHSIVRTLKTQDHFRWISEALMAIAKELIEND